MFKKIKAGQYKFLSPYWDPISAGAKDFVAKLLVVDWRKRMDAATALKHKWLAGEVNPANDKNLFAGGATAEATDGVTKQEFVKNNIKRQESRKDTLQAMEASGGSPPPSQEPEPGKAGCGCQIA